MESWVSHQLLRRWSKGVYHFRSQSWLSTIRNWRTAYFCSHYLKDNQFVRRCYRRPQKQFETFDLKTVPGEDIKKVVTYFQYACIRLENNNAMTPGFIKTLFNAFQTSSCEEFNAIISQWNRDIKLNTKPRPTYKVFLKEVERIYEGLYFQGDWNGTSIQTDSGFYASGPPAMVTTKVVKVMIFRLLPTTISYPRILIATSVRWVMERFDIFRRVFRLSCSLVLP